MDYITFDLFGLTLAEPNMFITDCVIAFAAFFVLFKIQSNQSLHYDLSLYKRFFMLTGIAAFIGGLGHLLKYYGGENIKVFGWIFSLLANFYILKSSTQYINDSKTKEILLKIGSTKFLIALIILFITKKFLIISIDTIISIAFIALPIHFNQWKITKKNGFKVFCYGVIFSMLTAVVSGFKISISDLWFHDKDINHLVVSGGILIMGAGIRKL